RHQRAQLGRDHRDHVEDHPLRLVVGLAEGLDNLQALGILELLLQRRLGLHAVAQLGSELGDIDTLEQLLDGLGAHHGLETRGAILLVELAEAGLILDDLALLHGSVAGIHHDVGLGVENGLKLAQRNVQQVADARGQALEEPDMRAGRGELDVAETLTADLRERDFDAALVADDAAVLHALVLAAEALPVCDGTKDAGAEQAIALRLERAVVDGLGLGDLAVRPGADLLRAGELDLDGVEVNDRAEEFEWAGAEHSGRLQCSLSLRVTNRFASFLAGAKAPQSFLPLDVRAKARTYLAAECPD